MIHLKTWLRMPLAWFHSRAASRARRQIGRRRTHACCGAAEILEERTLLAASPGLGAGNVLVSGEIDGTNWIFEYTPTGELVQSFQVPDGSPFASSTEHIRDIDVDVKGRIRIFNGTFAPFVTTLDPLTGAVEHRRTADWSIVNGTGYGSIGVLGKFVFVHDMSTSDSPGKGLVRFDTRDFSASRFAESTEYLYVTAGFDGLVYGRDATGLMHVFDPLTLQELRTFLVPFGHGMAVAANGDVFLTAADLIYHYDSQGNLLKTLGTGVQNLSDIDLHPDGRLVVSGRSANAVVFTDTSLNQVTSSFGVDSGLAFVAFTDALSPVNAFVTGAGFGGGPHVRVFDPTGAQRLEFFAYHPAFRGGVHVALGDVNGDGTADVITGAGPSGGPHVRVFDGRSGNLLCEFFAYAPAFRGGVHVAAGDVNGDGRAEIITGAGVGGGPHVRVFDAATGSVVREFFAFDPHSGTGVSVTAGDLDGDGRAEVVTVPGLGTPLIRVFNGETRQLEREFIAYSTQSERGVSLTVEDLDGDHRCEIIAGAGLGGAPFVRVFDGTTGALRRAFAAYDTQFQGGVRVAASDVNGDGLSDILTAAGFSGGPHVRGFDFASGAEILGLYAYNPAFTGGVFIAGSGAAGVNGTQALLASGVNDSGRAAASAGETLTGVRLARIVEAARARFTATGLGQGELDQLSEVAFSIADLPGRSLGLARPGRIVLDSDAAGFGWFIDATPGDDAEFEALLPQGLAARTVEAAQGIDLLTAVLHELNHQIGADDLWDHSFADDLMSAVLRPGVRRLPVSAELDELFGDDQLLAAFSGGAGP